MTRISVRVVLVVSHVIRERQVVLDSPMVITATQANHGPVTMSSVSRIELCPNTPARTRSSLILYPKNAVHMLTQVWLRDFGCGENIENY